MALAAMPSRKTCARALQLVLMGLGVGLVAYGLTLFWVPGAWLLVGVVLVYVGHEWIDDGETPAPPSPVELSRRVPVRRSR